MIETWKILIWKLCGKIKLHLFQEYLFRYNEEAFLCIRKGPSSSEAPYAREEHLGPAIPCSIKQ